jgi:hypothetical protein
LGYELLCLTASTTTDTLLVLLLLLLPSAVREAHKAWEGFDAEAMWVELDALEASARAARAAKAAKQAEEAAAAANAAALATSTKPEEEVRNRKLEQQSFNAGTDWLWGGGGRPARKRPASSTEPEEGRVNIFV